MYIGIFSDVGMGEKPNFKEARTFVRVRHTYRYIIYRKKNMIYIGVETYPYKFTIILGKVDSTSSYILFMCQHQIPLLPLC